jgi:hypothetical protein
MNPRKLTSVVRNPLMLIRAVHFQHYRFVIVMANSAAGFSLLSQQCWLSLSPWIVTIIGKCWPSFPFPLPAPPHGKSKEDVVVMTENKLPFWLSNQLPPPQTFRRVLTRLGTSNAKLFFLFVCVFLWSRCGRLLWPSGRRSGWLYARVSSIHPSFLPHPTPPLFDLLHFSWVAALTITAAA